MQRILKTSDRNLRVISRFTGIAPAVLAIAVALIPNVLGELGQLPLEPFVLLGLVAVIVCAVLQTRPRGELWAIGMSLSVVFVMLITNLSERNPGTASLLSLIGGIAVGSSAYVLVPKPKFRPLALSLAIVTITVTATTFLPAILTLQEVTESARITGVFSGIALGISAWLTPTIITIWIERASRNAAESITTIREANRVERLASEQEAERHRNARLLHDTVLATLTLLAHGARGVPEEAIREQAANDAQLLAQLRSGGSVTEQLAESGQPSGDGRFALEERAARLGLDVAWHGARRLALDDEKYEALFGAIAECLENVRRHSGVARADVTLTEDEACVRALVTDAGVGFDPNSRDHKRLGYTESILGRVASVGGNARVFSTPGAGTTVVLEVPR